MLRPCLSAGLVLMILAAPCLGEDAAEKSQPDNPQFERLKGLAGTWVMADENGQPTDQVVSVIRVTAGGSAVHETMFPGESMEMISVYHMDKGDLLMTHYCMLGNQPRMKADPASPPNQIHWKFIGGTNLDPQKDAHMHSAVVTFVDEDHMEVEGEGWENGKPSPESCGMMKLVRKK